MEQTSARVEFTDSLDSNEPNGMGFMINWFIEWSQISLLPHVVLSIICIQNVKLVMKEMVAGQCKVCYCLSHDVFP